MGSVVAACVFLNASNHGELTGAFATSKPPMRSLIPRIDRSDANSSGKPGFPHPAVIKPRLVHHPQLNIGHAGAGEARCGLADEHRPRHASQRSRHRMRPHDLPPPGDAAPDRAPPDSLSFRQATSAKAAAREPGAYRSLRDIAAIRRRASAVECKVQRLRTGFQIRVIGTDFETRNCKLRWPSSGG